MSEKTKPEDGIKNPYAKIDKSNMFDVLRKFPEQISQAMALGVESPWFREKVHEEFVILGVGGSAIAGDLIRSYALATKGADHVSITVSRGYEPPSRINDKTAFITSSYSGDTEETLMAFDIARKETSKQLCITSGGRIYEIAYRNKFPTIMLPKGYQPRCALAFSFFPLLKQFTKHTFKPNAQRETSSSLIELLNTIQSKTELYTSSSITKNPALALAKKLVGKVPVIYSASTRLDAVNHRLRGQIQENAKQVCFSHFLPEANHNEINSWSHPKDFMKKVAVIFLKDPLDHERIKLRQNIMKDMLKKQVSSVSDIEGDGRHLLTRVFTMIYFFDWVSYYLACLNGIDPSPVPVITTFKEKLGKPEKK